MLKALILIVGVQGSVAHASFLSCASQALNCVKDSCSQLLGGKTQVESPEAKLFQTAAEIEFATAALNQQEFGSDIQLKLFKNPAVALDWPLQVVAQNEAGGSFHPDLNFGYVHDGKQGRVYLKMDELFYKGYEFDNRELLIRRMGKIEQAFASWSAELSQTRQIHVRFKLQEGKDVVVIAHERAKMSPVEMTDAEKMDVDLFIFRKLAALIRDESRKMNPDFLMLFQEGKPQQVSEQDESGGHRDPGPTGKRSINPRLSPF